MKSWPWPRAPTQSLYLFKQSLILAIMTASYPVVRRCMTTYLPTLIYLVACLPVLADIRAPKPFPMRKVTSTWISSSHFLDNKLDAKPINISLICFQMRITLPASSPRSCLWRLEVQPMRSTPSLTSKDPKTAQTKSSDLKCAASAAKDALWSTRNKVWWHMQMDPWEI